VVLSEIGNGVVIRDQATEQPNEFYIALAFLFELP